MYNVYLVDDEKLVISNLKKAVPWLENGFNVIGSGTNPKTALSEILQMKPDVVISDLKMPFYNGLELMKLIKEKNTETEFIMLSAYGEYETCRAFFLMNGCDYILKPLDKENACLMLETLSRRLAEKRRQTSSIEFVPSQSKGFDDLVNYVTENFNKKHTLKDLSRMFGISPNYICNLFAVGYQSTLTIFITNLRMNEAGRLILKTGTPLKEIASHCGYTNYYYFCRVFKESFGKPPSDYREENG